MHTDPIKFVDSIVAGAVRKLPKFAFIAGLAVRSFTHSFHLLFVFYIDSFEEISGAHVLAFN